MKTNLIIGILLFVCIHSLAQTDWYKYPGNPVFQAGKEGEWDENLFDFDILFENDEYRMWYQGWSNDEPGKHKLGLATSSDGIHWEKHRDNPLDFKNKKGDQETNFWTFDIIKIGSKYLMWYTTESKDPSCAYKIGFASSADGITWNDHPEPVLSPGTADTWDAYLVSNPNVIFDGNGYHMWYTGISNRIPKIASMGYATSIDGIHWKKHPANPVLKHGKQGSWDDQWVVGYSVTTNGPQKEIWYFGYNLIKFEIGLATSQDGILWNKWSGNPVLKVGEMGEWDPSLIAPRVIMQDSVYRMWYGGNTVFNPAYGYATSSLAESESWAKENIAITQRNIRIQIFNRLEYINVDSLSHILPTLSGPVLIDAYNKLALAYSLNDDLKSYHYAEKAFDMAKTENYPSGRAMALYSMGNSQYVLNNYTDALVNQLTALRIFDSLSMHLEVGNLLSQIASIHTYAGSHDLACKYHQQALEVFKQLHDTVSVINVLNYLGDAFLIAGDTTKARETYKKMLFLAAKAGQTKSMGYAYEGLGKSYQRILLDSSIYYIMEARKIWEVEEFPLMTANKLLMAETYLAAGQEYYPAAEECLQKSLELLKQGISDAGNQLRWFYRMAELQISTGRYNEAKQNLDLSLEFCQTFMSKYSDRAYMSLNEKLEFGILLKEYMAKIYSMYRKLDIINKDKEAELQHYMLASDWKDSVSNDQAWKKVAIIEGNHEMEISRTQISLLEKENEFKNIRLKKSRIYLFVLGAFILIVIIGTILFIRQRKIRAQHTLELERVKSEKLQELDRLKSQFFANISHEFRTPLTLIMGPLDRILTRSQENNDKQDLIIAKKYATNLQNLTNNLQSLSKLESGKMLLRASEIDIVKIIRTYLQAFESLARQKNISLKFSSENKNIQAFIDQEKFEQILNNLLSNALKFTNEHGIIEVRIGKHKTAEDVLISISDTGCGISTEHIDNIFDRFYQGEQNGNIYYEGTGIGLALTKELVELHHGTIKVESEKGKGSSFTILLPLGIDHLKPDEIVEDKLQEIIPTKVENTHPDGIAELKNKSESDLENNNNQSILLIVEDNADMRSHIRKYFENEYQIIEAIDGNDGYEKSINHIPDIIISDVMMPNMDGNEFCRKIKLDERTSHIPVILLTARASKESKIEGLETGADDFITKPFDGEELQVRVENLIKQRKRIRKLLEGKIQSGHHGIQLDFTDSGLSSMDEQFLQKAMEVVNELYSDPQFNTIAFAQAIGLGRIQLNRKIKALTGQTTVNFIRTFRLNHAAEMIKNKSATIAEIAYDVGFNSPSYFTECFREYFGTLPSEYIGNE
jgi:signal transduction histidine kinase/DNA-binding response OmpR family regulator/predicted GH43/DUF377 family glycosyl hydrolase